MGLLLRLLGGEPLLFFPATIHFPMYDAETGTQYFPFKTLSMLTSLFCCIGGSLLAEHMFRAGILQPEMDVLGCVVNIDTARVALPSDTSFNVSCETLAMNRIRSTTDTTMNGMMNGGGGNLLMHQNGKSAMGVVGGGSSEQTALQPHVKAHQDYSTIGGSGK